jgi:four helix bundle protein
MSIDKHQESRNRTKMFALRVIKMSDALPRTRPANVTINQVLRSATSMAANYRAVGRARSKADFIAKFGMVLVEADDTVFWLEMLTYAGIVSGEKMRDLLGEANQLMLIFSASRRTAKS